MAEIDRRIERARIVKDDEIPLRKKDVQEIMIEYMLR
jgi:hypothetical protein